jgi:hypothetical protein
MCLERSLPAIVSSTDHFPLQRYTATIWEAIRIPLLSLLMKVMTKHSGKPIGTQEYRFGHIQADKIQKGV